jgi:hypothetical protein
VDAHEGVKEVKTASWSSSQRNQGAQEGAFAEALHARRIPAFTEEMLTEDLATLREFGAM